MRLCSARQTEFPGSQRDSASGHIMVVQDLIRELSGSSGVLPRPLSGGANAAKRVDAQSG